MLYSFQKSFNKIFKADWSCSQRSVPCFFWIPFCYLIFVSPRRFVDQRKVSLKILFWLFSPVIFDNSCLSQHKLRDCDLCRSFIFHLVRIVLLPDQEDESSRPHHIIYYWRFPIFMTRTLNPQTIVECGRWLMKDWREGNEWHYY